MGEIVWRVLDILDGELIIVDFVERRVLLFVSWVGWVIFCFDCFKIGWGFLWVFDDGVVLLWLGVFLIVGKLIVLILFNFIGEIKGVDGLFFVINDFINLCFGIFLRVMWGLWDILWVCGVWGGLLNEKEFILFRVGDWFGRVLGDEGIVLVECFLIRLVMGEVWCFGFWFVFFLWFLIVVGVLKLLVLGLEVWVLEFLEILWLIVGVIKFNFFGWVILGVFCIFWECESYEGLKFLKVLEYFGVWWFLKICVLFREVNDGEYLGVVRKVFDMLLFFLCLLVLLFLEFLFVVLLGCKCMVFFFERGIVLLGFLIFKFFDVLIFLLFIYVGGFLVIIVVKFFFEFIFWKILNVKIFFKNILI